MGNAHTTGRRHRSYNAYRKMPLVYDDELDIEKVPSVHETMARTRRGYFEQQAKETEQEFYSQISTVLATVISHEHGICVGGGGIMEFTLEIQFPRIIRENRRPELSKQFLVDLAVAAGQLGYKMRAKHYDDDEFKQSQFIVHVNCNCVKSAHTKLTENVDACFIVQLADEFDDDDDNVEYIIDKKSVAESSKFIIEPECLVCMDQLATVRGNACIHVCMCSSCANSMISASNALVCPLCRVTSRNLAWCL